MRLNNESLAELRKKLFHGCMKQIRERLLLRGITYTAQYVGRCLNPNHKNYNQDIVEEAIMMSEEYAVQVNKLCQRIDLLNDPIV
jgi:hypothetical protein